MIPFFIPEIDVRSNAERKGRVVPDPGVHRRSPAEVEHRTCRPCRPRRIPIGPHLTEHENERRREQRASVRTHSLDEDDIVASRFAEYDCIVATASHAAEVTRRG